VAGSGVHALWFGLGWEHACATSSNGLHGDQRGLERMRAAVWVWAPAAAIATAVCPSVSGNGLVSVCLQLINGALSSAALFMDPLCSLTTAPMITVRI